MLISIKTHPQSVDWHTDLDPWDEDLISTLYHVLKEPSKHFLGIFPPHAELNNKWEEDYRVKNTMRQSEGRTIVHTLYHHWLRSKEVTCFCYQYNWHLSVQYKTYELWLGLKRLFHIFKLYIYIYIYLSTKNSFPVRDSFCAELSRKWISSAKSSALILHSLSPFVNKLPTLQLRRK